MAKLITCVVCGKQYEYCQNCDKDHNFWRTAYCSKNCKDVYNVCSKYAFGHINKDAAKKELVEGAVIKAKRLFEGKENIKNESIILQKNQRVRSCRRKAYERDFRLCRRLQNLP